MAAASASHPRGWPAPMPPGILYLHGGVHYNGGWLLFNDFKEAIEHFSDPKFAAEFRRFVREQGREPITLFRNRDSTGMNLRASSALCGQRFHGFPIRMGQKNTCFGEIHRRIRP